MSKAQVTSSTFTIELPEGVPVLIAGTPEAIAREVRLAAAIEWYREGRISQGKAAEFAGLGRWEFIEALGRARVNVIHEEALHDDVEQASGLHRDLIRERRGRGRRLRPGRGRGPLPGPRALEGQAGGRRRAGRLAGLLARGGRAGWRWLARRLRWESNVDEAARRRRPPGRDSARSPWARSSRSWARTRPRTRRGRCCRPWAGWASRPRPRSLPEAYDRADPGPVPPASRPRHPRGRRPRPATAPARAGRPLARPPARRGARSRVAETIRDELAGRPTGGG